MNLILNENLQKLKAFKSNLTNTNASNLTTLIEEIKKELPEQYRIKLNGLKFFENYDDNHSIDDLPF